MERKDINEMMQEHVNTYSSPSDLKITDMRVANIDGAPKHCPLIKIYTNQGIVGFGEVRDASSATYALMLKSRLLGENPLNVDKLFRRIKQFGGHSRQGGGIDLREGGYIAGKNKRFSGKRPFQRPLHRLHPPAENSVMT